MWTKKDSSWELWEGCVLIGNPCCEGFGAHKNVICQLQVALSALIKLLTSFEPTHTATLGPLTRTQTYSPTHTLTHTHTHTGALNILDKCKWALYYQCRHGCTVESKTGRTTEFPGLLSRLKNRVHWPGISTHFSGKLRMCRAGVIGFFLPLPFKLLNSTCVAPFCISLARMYEIKLITETARADRKGTQKDTPLPHAHAWNFLLIINASASIFSFCASAINFKAFPRRFLSCLFIIINFISSLVRQWAKTGWVNTSTGVYL